MQIFLTPKEAQGKIRQSQGRAAAKNFAFNARKLILGSIGTPLDHLSLIAAYREGLVLKRKLKTLNVETTNANNGWFKTCFDGNEVCDLKWPQVDLWPHSIGRGCQAYAFAWVLWPSYLIWTS